VDKSVRSVAPWDENAWRYLTGEMPAVTTIGPTGTVTAPTAKGRRQQHYLVLLFWAGLAGSVYLWWRDTPAGSVDSVPAALIEAGRITGMVGGSTGGSAPATSSPGTGISASSSPSWCSRTWCC
jgi:hypothetical protein